jgi:hypothetical protein
MILCSNTFSFTGPPNKPLSMEDQDWLQQNIIAALLPQDVRWYLE